MGEVYSMAADQVSSADAPGASLQKTGELDLNLNLGIIMDVRSC
jgi:hypothetical protein